MREPGQALGLNTGFDDLHHAILKEHFTEIVVVDTLGLSFFWDTEREAGDLVDGKKEDTGDNKGVGEDSAAARELVSELDPVVVDPATWKYGKTVEGGNVVSGKETSHDVSAETTNTVESKDIETVVNLEIVLEVEGVVAGSGSDDSDWDGSVDWNVTASWGDTDETGNGTSAKGDDGPLLALAEIVDDTEGQGTARCSKIGVDGSVDGSDGHVDSGTTIEAEPTEPEEDGSEGDKEDVSWLVVGHLSTVVTGSAADDQSVGERTSTGRHVDGATASEVERSELEEPAGAVPCPASNWVVDDGAPDEEEDHRWE